MPCFTDPEQYEAQRKRDEATYTKHLACRLLTHIFFEESEKLKKEAYAHVCWYKSHLAQDIKYFKDQINSLEIHLKGSEYDRVFLRRDITREELINKFKKEINEYNEKIKDREELLRKIAVVEEANKNE